MKTLITLLFIGFSLQLEAGEKIDKSLTVEKNGLVEIHNVRGNISIVGWQKAEVNVSGSLDDIAEKFIFTTVNGHTVIKVKLPRNSHGKSRGGSNLTIMLPETSKVSFTGVATDLKVEKINQGIDINSVSGDIQLKQISGRTYINSVSGKLDLTDLHGNLEVSTVSGNIVAKGQCKRVSVSSVSADTELLLEEIGSALLSTVSGDIKITGKWFSDAEMKLSSVSGDAFFQVIGELDAQITMETAPGGTIINDYSDDKAKSTFINSHNLRFTAGRGNGVIRMSTVSGEIGLKTE